MPPHDVLQFECDVTLHQLLPPVAPHTHTHKHAEMLLQTRRTKTVATQTDRQ